MSMADVELFTIPKSVLVGWHRLAEVYAPKKSEVAKGQKSQIEGY